LQKVISMLKDSDLTNISTTTLITKMRNVLMETTNFGDTALHFSLRYEQYKISKCIVSILRIDSLLNEIGNIQNSSGKVNIYKILL
jgi:hypothetical protein